MNCHKLFRFYSSTQKSQRIPFSLKRGSMFYIKTINTIQQPFLKSIYRRYLKQSLKFYKTGNQFIGEYLFRLLQSKKQHLKEEHKKLLEINDLLDEIKQLNNNQKSKAQSQVSGDKNLQQKKPSPLFTKLKIQAKPQLIKSHQIRLSLQKQNRERILTQKILHDFQCLHHISNVMQNAMDLQKEMDFRTKQQTKLVRLSFNMSEYFTPSLTVRPGYQSLVMLEFLEDDMEYEVLSDKDKQFVRGVITKVCGPKKLNHSRYRSAVDYLKDVNAVINQLKIERTQIFKKDKKEKQLSKKQYQSDQGQEKEKEVQENLQNDDKDEIREDEWSLIGKWQRNQAVRKILSYGKKEDQLANKSQKKTKINYKLKKSLIFEILHKTKTLDSMNQSKQKLSQEFYQIVRRLFKLSSEETVSTNSMTQSQQSDKKKMKYRLLQDVILENQFIDEFINHKRIIIV